MNYAPVGAMGLAGYMAGQGQYQKWLADYQQKQQEILMRQQMQQAQLATEAGSAQYKYGYGGRYSGGGGTTGQGTPAPTRVTTASLEARARGWTPPSQSSIPTDNPNTPAVMPPIPPIAPQPTPQLSGGLINGMPQNQSGQPINPAMPAPPPVPGMTTAQQAAALGMTPDQLAFLMQKQTQPPVNTGDE
jgi:hypothetical protein